LDVGVGAPKALSVECIKIFCHVGDEVVSMLIVGVVRRNSSRVLNSSSLLECTVFAPFMALRASSLQLW
jgi:hypothetical protein